MFTLHSLNGEKKKWIKPILVVAVRVENGQEGVLQTCKTGTKPVGPDRVLNACYSKIMSGPCFNYVSS